ncbi:hypothetical protein D3C75_314670 [compost metagenome]
MIAVDWLKEKTGFKRLPPICYPFVFPFYLIFSFISALHVAIRWLLGFWICDYCGRSYGIKDDKYKIHISDYAEDENYNKCLACLTIEKLTDKKLQPK